MLVEFYLGPQDGLELELPEPLPDFYRFARYCNLNGAIPDPDTAVEVVFGTDDYELLHDGLGPFYSFKMKKRRKEK